MRTLGIPRRLLVLAGGLLLALLLAELVMRRYIHAPRVVDAELGFLPQPGVTTHWHTEGHGHGHWEERGFRRQENPAGAPPLLVLGDSITEAMQVDDHETYAARLAVHLQAAGRPMAVRNAGLAGASIARYAALAPTYRRMVEPRWTVIQFDEEDLSKALSPLETHFVRTRPDGPLEVVSVPALGHGGTLRTQARILRARSALFQQAFLQAVGFAGEWERWRPFRADPAPPREFVAPVPPPIEEELSALASAYQGRITFLYVATFDPRRPEARRPAERQVEEICARRGFSLVNIRSTFPEFVARSTAPFGFPNTSFNTGHLNEEGHDAIARAIAREVARLSADGLL